MTIEREYPILYHFIGGCFNQDWDLDGSTDHEVIQAFRSRANEEHLMEVVSELDRAIRDCENKTVDADKLLKPICDYYYPADGLTGLAWMKRIRGFLTQSAS